MLGTSSIQPMRTASARLLCCCLAFAGALPLAVHAGDNSIDTAFAATAAQPGWTRAFVAAGGFVDERIVAAARAPDGGYVLTGSRAGGAAGALIFLAKLRADGSADTSFGGSAATGNAGLGRVLKDAYLSTVTDMTIDAQGRIVVVGATPGALGQNDFGVVRFNADGTDDTSFAGDGGTGVAFDFDAANSRVNDTPNSVTTSPDGSVFVAGVIQDRAAGDVATTRVGVVKLMPDGSRDEDFGTISGGRGFFCGVQCENVLHVARIVYDAPRDRIVIGGDYTVASNNTDWFIITRTAGGTIQTNAYVVDLGGASGYQLAYMTDLAVQTDGKPVALGWGNDANLKSVPVLLRRLANSVAEDKPAFGNTPNRALMVLPWTDAIVNGLAIDSRGRIVLAGEYAPFKAGIAGRLLSSGAIDTNFNGTTSPSAYFAPTGATQQAFRTAFKRVFLDAGRPVLAGEAPDSNSAATDYDLVATRLQADLIFANDLE